MQQPGGVSEDNFEAVVRSQLGPSEFMLFHEINHSQWLPVYGVTQRVSRPIFGSPIIASRGMTTARRDGSAWIEVLIPAVILLAPFLPLVLGRPGRQIRSACDRRRPRQGECKCTTSELTDLARCDRSR
jgi:hypothetical protein